MNALHSLAAKQHDVVASWQLLRLGWSPNQVRERLRGLRRVHRGVCALGDLTELGWYMAAALAMGPTGVVSHLSAAMLMGLRPHESGPIHVSFTAGNRRPRADLIPHRRRALDAGTFRDVPVTSPTQTLRDADLEPHELYRALEAAEPFGICGSGPVAELLARVRGRTRSDAEARFVLLCDAHGFPLPLVNHHLN